jgi:nucleotide-binding universal stress UspA family protein
MFTRIAVPLDGSDHGDCALPLAAALACRSEAALELVHAHAGYSYAAGAPAFDRRLDDEVKAQMRKRLEDTRERVAAHFHHEASLTWLEGPVAPALELHVAESGADLVVMTTHGRSGLSRVWLGSVAERMARHSPVPVLFVRPTAVGVTWRGEPLLRRILIPLDGSERAETVLDHAMMLATRGEAGFTLLQVVVPLADAPSRDITNGIAFSRNHLPRPQRVAETYLEGVAAGLRRNGFPTTVKVIARGQTARAILEHAQRVDADLIALATHGRGAAARLVIGSVAHMLLRTATMPLLISRPAPDGITCHVSTARMGARQS